MKSKLLGFVPFNKDALARELGTLQSSDYNSAYGEYAAGEWRTAMLRNRSGDARDGESQEYDGPARTTALGKRLPYLAWLIERSFNATHIKSARLFVAANRGVIMPHRDYLEFRRGFFRVHLVLQTHAGAINREGDHAYHMREGEVWFVDGTTAHAGGVTTDEPRIHLCVDFAPDQDVSQLVASTVRARADGIEPCIVELPKLTPVQLQAIASLAPLLSHYTMPEVKRLLAKLDTTHDVETGTAWSWLQEVAAGASELELLDEAKAFKEHMLG